MRRGLCVLVHARQWLQRARTDASLAALQSAVQQTGCTGALTELGRTLCCRCCWCRYNRTAVGVDYPTSTPCSQYEGPCACEPREGGASLLHCPAWTASSFPFGSEFGERFALVLAELQRGVC